MFQVLNMHTLVLFFTLLFRATSSHKNPHYVDNRTTMVHLFEWKFEDIAKECEQYLGPAGFAAVQVSPIHENMIVPKRPWYERYQPISYKIKSRSGDEEALKEMVKRCNAVGVKIFVDVVINHMTGNQSPAIGIAGTKALPEKFEYPGVPYGPSDFHKPCSIFNYQNATEVRVCELSGLHDLDQSRENVRKALVDFLNRCIDTGIAGFRVDAAKHVFPEDLKIIYSRVKNLSINHGFAPDSRPFFYQEVIDVDGTEAVRKFDYNDFAAVVEFTFGIQLGMMFRNQRELKDLGYLGQFEISKLLPSSDAVIMIDNHDNQRGHGTGGDLILTYKTPKQYKMAIALMLAYPYGYPRLMSSFAFTDSNAGPPADENGNIISPVFNAMGICDNGWVCEHRWGPIRNMVKFRNIVINSKLEKWWTNDKNQIAFARGNLGFIVFNNQHQDLKEKLSTGLPQGRYCDVISGNQDESGKCSGKVINVDEMGFADIEIPGDADEGVIAIHIEAKLSTSTLES